MPATDPTAKICAWACTTRYEDIPLEVREEALRILCDEVGAMIAGATLKSCEPVVDLVRRLGGPRECSVIGHPLRAPLLNAAMVNGTIGHADELDPTSVHGAGHFAATMVPTALTMGQYVGISGRDFMRTFILGAEIAARMQAAINANRHKRPQFYYSAGAALGAAVTAGLMLGLDAEKMEHALGTAAMGCAPLMSMHYEELHQAKGLAYSGRTTRAGVESALLAKHGFHAPGEILTTENGFFHAFVSDRDVGHDVVRELGYKYLMKDLLYKRYSAGGPNLAPLYAFFQLMERHKFTSEDIVEVISTGAPAGRAGAIDHHPSIHTETVLSLAACYGAFTFSHAHDPAYSNSPRFEAFKKRARITIVPREGGFQRAHRLEAKMTVRTRDGREFQQAATYSLMTPHELEVKFRSLVGLRLDETKTMALERQIKSIERMDNIAPLVSNLEIDY